MRNLRHALQLIRLGPGTLLLVVGSLFLALKPLCSTALYQALSQRPSSLFERLTVRLGLSKVGSTYAVNVRAGTCPMPWESVFLALTRSRVISPLVPICLPSFQITLRQPPVS